MMKLFREHKAMCRTLREYNATFQPYDSKIWDVLIKLGILEEAI